HRALVVDSAGDQILHRRRSAAVGHVNNVDTDRRIEQHAGEMNPGAGAGRAVLHPRLIFPSVSYEISEIPGGKILTRDEEDRLVRYERHRREVADGVIGRIPVERLAVGMGTGGAEQELIAIGRRPRYPQGAGDAAAAADILNGDRLAEDV